VKLLIQMGPGYDRTVEQLGSMGLAICAAVSQGLSDAVGIAANNVSENYLTNQALKRRTGNLAKAVDGWMEGPMAGVVGVRPGSAVDKYKWILGDEQMTIRPRNAKFLCIPVGENLTPSGVARFSSPRQVDDGFFVKTKGRLLFGRKQGKRGRFRPLFTLVKEVLVQGSSALADGVMESTDSMTAAIQRRVDGAIGD